MHIISSRTVSICKSQRVQNQQKDIDLQYILMCVYILKKSTQPNTLNRMLLFAIQ